MSHLRPMCRMWVLAWKAVSVKPLMVALVIILQIPVSPTHHHTHTISCTSRMSRMRDGRGLSQRRAQRHAGSHPSPAATSPLAAIMCSLIGGADEVWWGRYLWNCRACYLDNAGEGGYFPFSSILCPSRGLLANPLLFVMAVRGGVDTFAPH